MLIVQNLRTARIGDGELPAPRPGPAGRSSPVTHRSASFCPLVSVSDARVALYTMRMSAAFHPLRSRCRPECGTGPAAEGALQERRIHAPTDQPLLALLARVVAARTRLCADAGRRSARARHRLPLPRTCFLSFLSSFYGFHILSTPHSFSRFFSLSITLLIIYSYSSFLVPNKINIYFHSNFLFSKL